MGDPQWRPLAATDYLSPSPTKSINNLLLFTLFGAWCQPPSRYDAAMIEVGDPVQHGRRPVPGEIETPDASNAEKLNQPVMQSTTQGKMPVAPFVAPGRGQKKTSLGQELCSRRCYSGGEIVL
jgi:hypothetical protein